jgi:L-threonylcarbamoyladenylate synthase
VTVVFEVDPSSPDRKAMTAATDALASGGLVVLPTETVYGIAARPDVAAATKRLFEAKRRPPSLNLPILASSESQAWTVVEPTPGARALASEFWPGGLTLVLPRASRSSRWSLGDRTDTVAVRVPDHPVALALLRRTGVLAVTSANVSGRPPGSDREGLLAAFSDTAEVILVLREGAGSPAGVASTVVDCTSSEVSVLREGAVPEAEIRRVAEGGPPGSR